MKRWKFSQSASNLLTIRNANVRFLFRATRNDKISSSSILKPDRVTDVRSNTSFLPRNIRVVAPEEPSVPMMAKLGSVVGHPGRESPVG